TIMSLKPDAPLIVSPLDSVYSISEKMSKQKIHCVMVKATIAEKIIGIFTTKDLAFRVIAKGLHPKLLKVKDIMTKNPYCSPSNLSASDALNLMVKRNFRHLPIRDDTNPNKIIGILDITKCFNQVMLKLEKIAKSTHNLNNNIDNLSEGSSLINPDLVDEIKNLISSMKSPTLDDVLNEPNHPAPVFIDSNQTIRFAAEQMRKNKCTAVLVKDTNGTLTKNNSNVIGIFTSKDIVFRVLANDLDPESCTIARCMTTQPKLADRDLTVQSALKLMYDGHFLNLPVIDDDKNIIGIVDVLQLTCMALNQLNKAISKDESYLKNHFDTPSTSMTSSGPAWDRFWRSVDRTFEDTASSVSDISYTSGGPLFANSNTPS
ncbi:CBS domain-containing protein, partial [Ascoidea rubescens DSM 1968]